MIELALVCVAVLAVGFTLTYWMSRGYPWWRRPPRWKRGCCTACDGLGTTMAAPETNGQCWDCRGTGHSHAGKCTPWWRRFFRKAWVAPRDGGYHPR